MDAETAKTARKQFMAAKGPQMIDCGACERSVPIRFLFRCYYCRVYYCDACAGDHFGKSREEYQNERGASLTRAPARPKAKSHFSTLGDGEAIEGESNAQS